MQLKDIISFLYAQSPKPYVFIVAILLMYLTLLRQSNLLSDPSGISPHRLQFADVRALSAALLITIKSMKTQHSSSCPLQFTLPALQSSLCCPVQVWKNYIASSHPDPSGPALVLPSSKPLIPRLLNSAISMCSCAPWDSEDHSTWT